MVTADADPKHWLDTTLIDIPETRVKEIGGASVTLIQTVMRGDQRLVEAEVTVVLVSISGKPLRLSEAVRRAFLAQTQAQDPR